MEDRILECVPNFSEGKNLHVIAKIKSSIINVKGTKLLHVDVGSSANRTVMTFAGNPNSVVEAAYQAAKTAKELINMSQHKGTHPRLGAIDVCPLIPIKGIDIQETILLSKQLGQRIGDTLNIPVYLYEASNNVPYRKNLAAIRKGEYEGLENKMKEIKWRPDYGPLKFNSRSGATVIGARNFLIAYNININTKDLELAKLIASELREKPSVSIFNGKKYSFNLGLKKVKAIGWFVPEYNTCQISCNIIDFNTSGIHDVFEKTTSICSKYGLTTNGSELIGMIPKQALYNAGLFYSPNAKDESTVLSLAISNLGLNSVKPFDTSLHILENLLS